MTAPFVVERVRKARGKSVCGWPGCNATIRVGNQIGRVPGYGWCHIGCIIEGQERERGQANR